VADVPAKVVATWLAAARKALAANRQSFAMLPIDELLRPGAYLQALQADGYAVEAPDGDLTDEHDAAPPAPAPAGR
jgi:hypothetical protein